MAARLSGAGTMRIVAVHLLPNVISHILVIATLSIPSMILGETALSYLGLGIRPPYQLGCATQRGSGRARPASAALVSQPGGICDRHGHCL